MRVVFFDIDGTLVNVLRDVTLGIFLDAVREAIGYADPFEMPATYRFHGRTDRSIFIDVAEMMSVDREAALECIPRFEEILLGGWNRSLNAETIRVLPGIPALLERLESDPDVTLGLLTGNLEGGAHAKLSPHDLHRFFAFGAFGSDAIERNDLPPIALERANMLNGHRFGYEHAVIVGDSNRDIECARAWGIRSLAVATGGLTANDLAEHSPDALMETLEDADEVIRFIHE